MSLRSERNFLPQIKNANFSLPLETDNNDTSVFSSFLQVLDLGFNLLRVLPAQAFRGTKHLTLLAVDGNPMATLPEAAFAHLNESLRGLSLGGRFLTCDCNLRWVSEWIEKYELQVTSRARNPQFCEHPQRLRDKNFYDLSAEGEKKIFLMVFFCFSAR